MNFIKFRYTKVTIHYYCMYESAEYTKTLPLSKKVQEFCAEYGTEFLEIYYKDNLILIESNWYESQGTVLQKAKTTHPIRDISSYEWIL